MKPRAICPSPIKSRKTVDRIRSSLTDEMDSHEEFKKLELQKNKNISINKSITETKNVENGTKSKNRLERQRVIALKELERQRGLLHRHLLL